jgi:hypothetical protein
MVESMKLLIFSLDTETRQPGQEEYETMKTHMLTSKMHVTNSKGVYKGIEEDGFICVVNEEIQEKMIMAIAHAYKQECVLEVELPSRKGYLKFFDGKPAEYVGLWKEAGIDVKDDFTINLDTMKVYRCVPETSVIG